jgi:enoyl-CoA hydratase/carnithine racemase
MQQDAVLFDEIPGRGGHLGVIQLNRPSQLNALNLEMVRAMISRLETWAASPDIKAVIIRASEGRAFCAGGDLRAAYEAKQQNHPGLRLFFHEEYRLNRLIFHFPKPYIALLNGITMGGGACISLNGSHCVGTEHLLFAMPETGIGFFPDVGATYFLSRLPHHIGFYLALTGARIKREDCFALHLINVNVKASSLNEIVTALAEQVFGDHAKQTVSTILKTFHSEPAPSSLLSHHAAINTCFSQQSIEKIIENLQQSSHAICREVAPVLSTKSPTSLKVTLAALCRGKTLSFDECMRQEYRLTSHFLQSHDFMEGIRAVIIDKDQTPRWQPPHLEDITQPMIDHYFAPIDQDLC